MDIISLSLSHNDNAWTILSLIIGCLVFLAGSYILFKGTSATRFAKGISGLWFFGFLTYMLGWVIIANTRPSDSITASWIVVGCSIGFALIGAGLGAYCEFLGTLLLGAASGWTFWLLIAPFIPNEIANLVVAFVLAIVEALFIYYYQEKIIHWSIVWIGANSVTFSLVTIIFDSISLSGATVDYNLAYNVIHGVAIALTLIIFGAIGFVHHQKCGCDPKECIKEDA